MTASNRINSHTDIKRIDETRGKLTVVEVGLLVNGKNIDRQTYAYHMVTGRNTQQDFRELFSGHVLGHR